MPSLHQGGCPRFQLVRLRTHDEGRLTNRTEVAMLRAKGPWKVVDADTKRTDCAAKGVGPSLRHVLDTVGDVRHPLCRPLTCSLLEQQVPMTTIHLPPVLKKAQDSIFEVSVGGRMDVPTPLKPNCTKIPRFMKLRCESGCQAVRGTKRAP